MSPWGAIARSPDLFLFDEPLSNLDAKLRVEMRTEIKRLHERLGTTIIYATHDQIEAMTLATKVAVMKGGYVQQLAYPRTIYERHRRITLRERSRQRSGTCVQGSFACQRLYAGRSARGAESVRC